MKLKDKTEIEKLDFIQYAIDKVYFYIDSKFWSKLTIQKLQRWLNNFNTIDEKYCAAKLLDRFVYFSEADIIQLLKFGLNEIFLKAQYLKKEIESDFKVSSDELNKLKSKFIEETAILPLGEGNLTDSSNAIARYLCNEIGFSEEHVLNPIALESKKIQKFKRVLIIDDFVGSGDQIIEFWSQQDITFDGGKHKMFEIADILKEVKFEYFCLVVTEEGYNRFYSDKLKHDKSLVIRYCEMLTSRFKVFGDSSAYFSSEEMEECKLVLQNITKKNGLELEGWRNLDYAIAFHHCIPDASLPLFYEKSETWNYLIRNKKTKEHVDI